jgi:hypothetical protein
LYDEPYRSCYPSRAELATRYKLDPSRRWIFFPENYNWAFYSEATIRQFIRGGQSAEEIHAMRLYCESSLKEVLQWFAFAAQNKNVEIILRPRPSTTLDEFRVVVKDILPEMPAHLHLIQQESVREWILVSDVVLSSHSTSLIEGAVAGRPVFMVEPHPIPAALKVKWHDLLGHIKTRDEFIRACAGSEGSEDTRLKDWARRNLMNRGDSIFNLADFILALLVGEVEAPHYPSREVATPALKWIPPAWFWSIYRRAKQKVRFRETSGIEPEFVKDVVSRDEVKRRIHKWSRLLATMG